MHFLYPLRNVLVNIGFNILVFKKVQLSHILLLSKKYLKGIHYSKSVETHTTAAVQLRMYLHFSKSRLFKTVIIFNLIEVKIK